MAGSFACFAGLHGLSFGQAKPAAKTQIEIAINILFICFSFANGSVVSGEASVVSAFPSQPARIQ
jgi:hypothetical protein